MHELFDPDDNDQSMKSSSSPEPVFEFSKDQKELVPEAKLSEGDEMHMPEDSSENCDRSHGTKESFKYTKDSNLATNGQCGLIKKNSNPMNFEWERPFPYEIKMVPKYAQVPYILFLS
mmetsp:Transcript_32473/g.28759  ORF Transcript_32473/g.28759 Transcript_32473/m.28759 type:complete len:118 (+) Transcript_32473:312-665(+)